MYTIFMDKLRQFDGASENSTLHAVRGLLFSTPDIRQTFVMKQAVARLQEHFLRILGKRRRV